MPQHYSLLHVLTLLILSPSACAASDDMGNKTLIRNDRNETPITFTTPAGDSVAAFQGELSVPERHDESNDRTLPLRYVRFPATSDNTGSPIVYLAGGPGGSGIATARYRRFALFMAMREFGDVIALDQRGTGDSDTTLPCESSISVPIDTIVSDEHYFSLHRQALRECLTDWREQDFDPQAYTTPQSVGDLAELRKHLGTDKISLWGISYGSHLALAALKTIPEQIDRVVLASAEGLDQTIKYPARTDAYFSRLQQAIDSQPAAREMFPDIAALIRRVHKKLDEQPLALTFNNSDGQSFTSYVYRRDLQQLTAGAIADPASAGHMLQLYRALDYGVTEPLQDLVGRYLTPGEPIRFRLMSTAMDLASGITPLRRLHIENQARSALLGGFLNFSLHLTDAAPELDLGEDFRQPPESDVPTLLLSGTLDGRTYLVSQHQSVAGLRRLTTVTVENAGHNLYMSSPVVTAVIQQFMRGEAVEKKTITIPLPDFAHAK